ncbi:MAG: radical SAM protein [Armatimonadetes bacterium]|nr:radical SAM protein [Armatimonadota bacterium]
MRTIFKAKVIGVRKLVGLVVAALRHVSDANIIRTIKALEMLAWTPQYKDQLRQLREAIQKGHPVAHLVRRIFHEASPPARRALINNLGINNTYLASTLRQRRQQQGLAAPSLIVISPTMRCNLACKGCYAGEYLKQGELSFDEVDDVIMQGKRIGVYFYTISGGEPFIRDDLMDIFAKHRDCSFLVYTNGTFINADRARALGELGNAAPAISIEGFREETDDRRGEGVWDRVMAAMDNLRSAGVIFGYSATVTRHNVERITSPELVDLMIDKGCYFGWYFHYIPIGKNPDPSLMPTPEQRQYCRRQVWRARAEKPIFLADFWNDGRLTGGCMSGGRLYLHVTASGEVEPCVFCHFSGGNIKQMSLEEILDSDFFRALRNRFPWSDNELTPCAIIDNPHVLREAVAEGHARPSHPGAETIITDLAPALDEYSAHMHELTDNDPDAHLGSPWAGPAEEVRPHAAVAK